MKKNIILCAAYIILIFIFTACGKDAVEQKPSDELVTLGSPMESTASGVPEFKTQIEIKSISYVPLQDGWTEVKSEQCSRLYSETGLAAIVMNKITSSNTASFGDITDMETYVKSRMSIQYVLKSAEPVESEYGNVVVDVIVVDENYMEELETFARHVSIR